MEINYVVESYNRVSGEYVKRIYDELGGKPFDREILVKFVRSVGSGTICDLGCGPGHVSRFLKDCGASVLGMDLSHEMIARARELNPDIGFQRGDILEFDVRRNAFAGIVSFYSIVNIEPALLTQAFNEIYRALLPGGRLLLSFHLGNETVHLDEWWDLPVSLDFFFFEKDQVLRALFEARFEIEAVFERDPYPEIEHQSRRAYVVCQK